MYVRLVLCVRLHSNRCTAARQVLPIKLVTQCAMLQDFGIFLVLADGVRLARSIAGVCTMTGKLLVTLCVPH